MKLITAEERHDLADALEDFTTAMINAATGVFYVVTRVTAVYYWPAESEDFVSRTMKQLRRMDEEIRRENGNNWIGQAPTREPRLHDLPVFEWAWRGDAREVER